MINNYLCEKCVKFPVCKIADILFKFHEDNKKPLGVAITMDRCSHFDEDFQHEG